jgi:hypothetical protein
MMTRVGPRRAVVGGPKSLLEASTFASWASSFRHLSTLTPAKASSICLFVLISLRPPVPVLEFST